MMTALLIILLVIAVLIAGLLIYMGIPYSPNKSAFLREMEDRVKSINASQHSCSRFTLDSTLDSITEVLQDSDLVIDSDQVPEPVRRYLDYIGLHKQDYHPVIRAEFLNTNFVMDSQTGKKIKMDYDLWLFFDKPFRQAFCSSRVGGIPFEGIDYCTDNRTGGMKGILGKTIQIFDECNEQGYKAVLLSWLAEGAAFNPAVLLSEYVKYEAMDAAHVKAWVRYDGVIAGGIFTINAAGQITNFYSDERQVEMVDSVMTPIGWRCDYSGYHVNDEGHNRITRVSCVKVFPAHELTYFDSENIILTYPLSYYGTKREESDSQQ